MVERSQTLNRDFTDHLFYNRVIFLFLIVKLAVIYHVNCKHILTISLPLN